MEARDNRLNSFNKPKSSKSSKASSSKGWPHPNSFAANPATLADAGFYHNPSEDDPDNVACFMCQKELGGWEEEDNPFDIHVAKCPKCPWAIARCSLEYDCDSKGNFKFKDASRLPSNKVMEKARLDTFGGKHKWWPHDSDKSHGATSKKLAKAGFVYTPQKSGEHDDTATCYYCDLSLSGWDPDDDPIVEHKKREGRSGKSCAFFSAKVSKPSTSNASNLEKSSRTAKKVAPSNNASQLGALEENKKADGTQATHFESVKQTKTKIVAKARSKPGGLGDFENPAPKKTSQRKKSTKQPPPTENDEVEKVVEDEISPTRDQSKLRNASETQKSRKVQKGKKLEESSNDASGGKNVEERVSNHGTRMPGHFEDYIVAMDEDVEDVQKSKLKSTSSRARSRSKSRAASERSTSRASTKSHTRSRSKTIGTEDEAGEVAADTAPKSLQNLATSTKKASHPSNVDSVQSGEENDPRTETISAEKETRIRAQHPAVTVALEVDEMPFDANQHSPRPKNHNEGSDKPLVEGSVQSSRISVADLPSSVGDLPAKSKDMAVIRLSEERGIAYDPVRQVQSDDRQAMDVDEDGVSGLSHASLQQPELKVLRQSSITRDFVQPPLADISLFHVSPPPFLPPLAEVPISYKTELSEVERAMTVEEYIRYEMSIALKRLRLDGERTIGDFKRRAAEARAQIEAL